MSEWSPQASPRRESDGVGRLVGAVRSVGEQVRESTSNLLRTAGVLAKPGRITSIDFDGVDHTNLGTRGWSLGRDGEDTASYLALNGLDVYETLQSQIDAIEDAQETLAAQQATLTSQQAALAAQQTELAAQQAALTALVAGQVAFGIAPTTTFSGWASTTGQDTKASSTIPVPAGYSQALVFALASMHFMDTSPNGGWVRATIAGEAGGEMGGLANLQLGQSASHTRALTGLSGSPIVIQCQMRSSVATGGMSGRIAQVSGFALFLR